MKKVEPVTDLTYQPESTKKVDNSPRAGKEHFETKPVNFTARYLTSVFDYEFSCQQQVMQLPQQALNKEFIEEIEKLTERPASMPGVTEKLGPYIVKLHSCPKLLRIRRNEKLSKNVNIDKRVHETIDEMDEETILRSATFSPVDDVTQRYFYFCLDCQSNYDY